MRIISGLGLPTKNALTPLAFSMSAATAPHAGTVPPSPGPFGSGLVAMKRAPASISRTAWVKISRV
jgi:hypothetical protein